MKKLLTFCFREKNTQLVEKANQKVVKAVADIKNGKYPKEGLGTRTFS